MIHSIGNVTASAPVSTAGPRPVLLCEPEAMRLGRDQSFNTGWKFFRGSGEGFEAFEFNDSTWRIVDLPHDWSIEDLPRDKNLDQTGPFDPNSAGGTATGFTVGGEGWYRKHFQVPALSSQVCVEILFGGVYSESNVWLNGCDLGNHVHGYTPFGFDLTPYIRPENNILVVRVRNLGKNSRWYSGSGIYRDVTLNVLPQPAHISRWGVGVTTRRITDSTAEIEIETHLTASATGLTLISQVRDPTGAIISSISSAATEIVSQPIILPSPYLWSPETPKLYILETELWLGKTVIDALSTPFGVRIVTLDADTGMQINGTPVKLRGGCVHHDNGLLGAAAYPDAEDRRVRLLRARGFNAIRSSHNPSSRAFADACDRHGILLIEEIFDIWHAPKNPQDYSVHFAEAWKADLTAMVLSARNHPSVIMWSIGNEIPHRSTPEGVETAWSLANEVHRLDPSRPVTAAINGFAGRPLVSDENTARKGFANVPDESAALFLDLVGYNYKFDRYATDHARFPKRVMYGSESFPKDLFEIWDYIDTHPYVVGDFVWAAMDYLGEAGLGSVCRNTSKISMPMTPAWPWIVSNVGDLDLTGRQKPPSLARDVVWGVSAIEIAVLRPLLEGMYEHASLWGWSDERQSWTWPGHEGQLLAIRVYARAERVELRLNGKVMQTKLLTGGEKLPVEFNIPYAAGSLEAVAYCENREIGRRTLVTVGAPAAVRLTPETPTATARDRLTYVWAEVCDKEGRVVPDVARKIRLTVTGPAKLIGFGSGVPLATASFQSNEAETHDGRALMILKSEASSGTVCIDGQSEGLCAGTITLRLT